MKTDQKGFTLVELMVTLAMTGIVVAAVYSTYTIQQRAYGKQEQVNNIQSNLRAGLYIMVDELRMAGYAGTASHDVDGISAASATSLTFNVWDDDDTDANNPKSHTYTRAAGSGDNAGSLTRDGQVLADNIESIEFQYILADGSTTLAPSKTNNIRAVTISILGRAEHEDSSYTNNDTYTTASGAVWKDAASSTDDDHYRRRFLITTVQCRNMGL